MANKNIELTNRFHMIYLPFLKSPIRSGGQVRILKSFIFAAFTSYLGSAEPNFKMDGKKHTATWNGVVIAESDKSVEVENNHYFPPNSVKMEYFQPSAKTSVCPWKGNCKYFDVVVNGKVNKAAAWYYPEPKDAAKNIKGYVAFWGGVEVD